VNIFNTFIGASVAIIIGLIVSIQL
jgi:hypothetical protein